MSPVEICGIFPGGQHGIDHRGCKGVLLLPDAFDVDPTLIIERQDEVHTPDPLDRNAVAEFDDDFGHARTLTCPFRHRMVRRVSHQPLEHAGRFQVRSATPGSMN